MINSNSKKDERRRYIRQNVYEGIHAIINLDDQIHGQIINISRDGLCFCYVEKGRNELRDIETDVYLDNNGKFVAKLPCKVIWDKKVSYSSTRGQDLIRECGVQFMDCNENQIAQLNFILGRDSLDTPDFPFKTKNISKKEY